ncbi:hypothetical protein [Falsiroseomonas sp. HW251]|uniref:hypothetical protein n=1 Tax=Falsiroseomonas sp. HW251 TaxID=3390998 RepID=UPI003D31A439
MRGAVLAGLLALAACATPPPRPGEELRAEVLFRHDSADMARNVAASPEPERSAMESSGFAQAVREGRAVRLRCALADDEPFVTDAIAPPGLDLRSGSAVRFTLGSTSPAVPNRILGPLDDPAVQRGWMPRQQVGTFQIVPWSASPVLAPVTAEQERVYARLRAALLVRCRPQA